MSTLFNCGLEIPAPVAFIPWALVADSAYRLSHRHCYSCGCVETPTNKLDNPDNNYPDIIMCDSCYDTSSLCEACDSYHNVNDKCVVDMKKCVGCKTDRIANNDYKYDDDICDYCYGTYKRCSTCDSVYEDYDEDIEECKDCYLGAPKDVCIENDSQYVEVAVMLMKLNESISPLYKRGSDGYFLRITSDIGIKFYTQKHIAKKTYERQFRASAYGLAPPIGTFFEARCGNNRVYAYVTGAIRETIYDECVDEIIKCNYDEIRDQIDNHDDYHEWQDIEKKLGLLHLCGDVHEANVGSYKGSIVCIDFSRG